MLVVVHNIFNKNMLKFKNIMLKYIKGDKIK